MKETVQWTAPSPLWEKVLVSNSAVTRRKELSRPSILRFATDSFMDDYLQMLANDPKKLEQYVALPETWRGIAPAPETISPAPAFARNLRRLGLISARKKEKLAGLAQTTNIFSQFAETVQTKPLKLFQPAHQRYYLVSACLVCERPGLPDKTLVNEREEKVSYVVRRLFPPPDEETNQINFTDKLPPLDLNTWQEYAFVMTDQGFKWKKTTKKTALESGEEQLPLFAVNFTEDDGRPRKLFSAVIPAGRREAYMSAGDASVKFTDPTDPTDTDPNKAARDPRVSLMRKSFRDPWKALLQKAKTIADGLNAPSDPPLSDSEKEAKARADKEMLNESREQIQHLSWLILLDFADFLEEYLPRIWNEIKGIPASPSLSTDETNLKNAILGTKLSADFVADLALNDDSDSTTFSKFLEGTTYGSAAVSRTFKDALIKIKGTKPGSTVKYADDLESVAVSYSRRAPDTKFPDFLFPLIDAKFNVETNTGILLLDRNPPNAPQNKNQIKGEENINVFAKLIENVLLQMPTNPIPQPIPLAAQTPMDMRQGWFLIRCVYERPLCGGIDPPVLSDPTLPFQIAGFFDPDAPARPIRISLPVDTTPAGLRKFDKNTAFMMSDVLCGQVNRMKGITFADLVFSILPFPFHKSLSVPDGGSCEDNNNISIGMMCSLSIPIITICALILLMIIIALLDFIFRWIPFFMICFPLPGLKAKDE